MTRSLLLIAGCGFVAALISFAIVLALGPVIPSDWNWNMDHDGHWDHRPAVMGDGPETTRTLVWSGENELHVNIPADIAYTQGPDSSLTITGPKGTVDHVEVDEEALRFDRRVRSPGRLKIVMTAPSVREFHLAGAQHLTIEAFDQDHLEVHIAGTGDVHAKGRARKVEAHIAGSGDIDFGEVEAWDGEVHIAGSGKAVMSPKDSADIHIAGSGDVILTTNPPHIEQHIAGAGRIVQGEGAPKATVGYGVERSVPAVPAVPAVPPVPRVPKAPVAPLAKAS